MSDDVGVLSNGSRGHGTPVLGVEPPRPVMELGDYLAMLRMRLWMPVAGLVAFILIAVGYTALQPASYTSTGAVLVRPVVENPFQLTQRPDQLVDMDTESALMKSTAVAERARAALNLRSDAATVSRKVAVFVPPNSQIMQVSFSASTPRKAQQGAQAVISAYLGFKLDQAQSVSKTITAGIQNQVADLETELVDVTGKLAAAAPNSPDRALAQSRQNVITGQLANLRTQLTALQALDLNPGEVIQLADLPTRRSSPILALNLGVGALVGLLLGFAAAVLAGRTDQRVRSAAELERRFGVPVLAVVPRHKDEDEPVALPGRNGAAVIAYQRLAATLLGRGDLETLLVAGTGAGDRGAEVAVNLALIAGAGGLATTLVSANLEDDKIESLLAVREEASSEEVIELGGNWYNLRQYPVPGIPLAVVTSRHLRPVATPALAKVAVGAVRAGQQFVVIESAPLSDAASAITLAPVVSGVLLVVSARRGSRDEVSEARHQLDLVQGNVVGAVLTDCRVSRRSARVGRVRLRGGPQAKQVEETPTPPAPTPVSVTAG